MRTFNKHHIPFAPSREVASTWTFHGEHLNDWRMIDITTGRPVFPESLYGGGVLHQQSGIPAGLLRIRENAGVRFRHRRPDVRRRLFLLRLDQLRLSMVPEKVPGGIRA